MLIGQNIGLESIIPVALEKLQINILEEGDFYPGDLLVSLFNSTWIRENKSFKAELLEICNNQMEKIQNDLLLKKAFFEFKRISI